MLWTALCWVVSEGQQSRSLSDCGYTSHSGVDGRTGALLLPQGDKLFLGSHRDEIRESGGDCWLAFLTYVNFLIKEQAALIKVPMEPKKILNHNHFTINKTRSEVLLSFTWAVKE